MAENLENCYPNRSGKIPDIGTKFAGGICLILRRGRPRLILRQNKKEAGIRMVHDMKSIFVDVFCTPYRPAPKPASPHNTTPARPLE